jgi:hypothetical protein
VKQVEAVEKLANVLTTKVGTEAEAILFLNTKTSESVLDTLRAAKNIIKESSSASDTTNLLSKYAGKIKQQLETTKQLATVLQSDITTHKSSLDLLKTSNLKVVQLLEAAEHQVEMAKQATITGEFIDAMYIEQNIVDVKSATLAVLDAAKASSQGVDRIKSAATVMAAPAVEKAAEVVKEAKLDTKVEAEKQPELSKPEVKAESKSIDAKEEPEAAKPAQKVEPKSAESKEPEVVKSESKTESKSVEEAKPEPDATNSEPKAEFSLEVDAIESVETKQEATPEETIEPKQADMKEDALSDNSVINAHSKEASKDARELEEAKTESKPQSNHVVDGTRESNSASDPTHSASTSESPASETANPTAKTVAHSAIESHSDLVASHDASDSANLLSSPPLDGLNLQASPSEIVHEATDSADLLSSTSLDAADLHAASEIVHKLATAPSNFVESVHDLVVATSFLL